MFWKCYCCNELPFRFHRRLNESDVSADVVMRSLKSLPMDSTMEILLFYPLMWFTAILAILLTIVSIWRTVSANFILKPHFCTQMIQIENVWLRIMLTKNLISGLLHFLCIQIARLFKINSRQTFVDLFKVFITNNTVRSI